MAVMLLLAIIIVLFALSKTCSSPTITDPSSFNVTIGTRVGFDCTHSFLDNTWTINGTVLGDSHFPPAVSTSQTVLGTGGIRHTLIIDATLKYDNTVFACALITDEIVTERSEPALLRVQGLLDSPSRLNNSRDYTTNTTTITWTPPPSIDLTNVEPDIVYCIEVQNITCGERGDVIVSECGITEPIYQSRDIPLNYIYNITVTPMSNVEGTLNGTPAYMEENFPILSQITSVSQRGNGKVNVMVTMDITGHNMNKPLPSTYSLSLAEVNNNNPTLNATVKKRRGDSIDLDLVGGLKVGEILDCIVVAYTCNVHPLTNRSVLSTHLIQDISFPPPNPGEILVTGDFLNSSTTTGLLVIAYTSSSNVRYHFYSRTPNEQNFRTVINNLEAGDYHVSVFTVENGLPFRDVATLPLRVSVNSTEDIVMQQTIDYELQSTSSTGVCITCTFLESSIATDCVAVVHQRISQLNSSAGLMNIESSHKFTRSGDSASGCIEGVNLEDYQVGVVGGRKVQPVTGTSTSTRIIVGVSVSMTGLVFILILTAILAKCINTLWSERRKKEAEGEPDMYNGDSAKNQQETTTDTSSEKKVSVSGDTSTDSAYVSDGISQAVSSTESDATGKSDPNKRRDRTTKNTIQRPELQTNGSIPALGGDAGEGLSELLISQSSLFQEHKENGRMSQPPLEPFFKTMEDESETLMSVV